jgi:porin
MMPRSPLRAAALLAASLLASSLYAQQPAPAGDSPPAMATSSAAPETPATPPAPPPFGGPLLERPNLTGDWFGVRNASRDCGITWDISSTNFYQGVTSGGLQDTFRFGGRADVLMNVDGEKAGLWKGLFITLHDETLYGDSVNNFTGAISPISIAQIFPVPDGPVNALTGVKFTQALSEQFLVFAGKINTVDGVSQPYNGAANGVNGFMNASICFPMIMVRTVPYSALGGGAAYLVDMQPVASVMFLDTANTPTTSGFNDFFQNGVTILGTLNVPTKLLDRPGHQGISFTYSSGKFAELDTSAYLLLKNISQGLPAFGRTTGSWSLSYAFDQAIWVDETNPKRSWGIFGNAGLSDGNPNPIRWAANLGLGGASPIASRKLDTFGVAWFQLGVSDTVKNIAPRLFPIRDERGVELFYNAGLTPWLHITPDLQVVTPARNGVESSVNFGIRARIDF